MAVVALTLLAGCIPAVEQHGGAAPIPSRMPDVGFVAMGATVDQTLIWAKVPTIPRMVADLTAAWALRNVSTFGRSADSGFLFVIGVWPPEFLHLVSHAGDGP